MQTAAIGYRVADFLKQHPPFQGMEETDLLQLVSRGRVKFHEIDEFLCWQGSAYAPLLFVLQQGSVSLWEEAQGKELLRDILGPGDMVGIERFLGSTAYPYSAKANSDVVVYALPAADFAPMLEKYPHAARYVDAHAAAGAVYNEACLPGPHERFVAELGARQPEPVTCSLDCQVEEAARLMRQTNTQAIAVVRNQEIRGIVTGDDFVRWAAEGARTGQSVQLIMGPPPPAVAPHASVSDCVLAMSGARAGLVALTSDGTSRGALLRLISPVDLQPAFGDNPMNLLEEIRQAADVAALRVLHLRARALLLAQLTSPAAVDWLSLFADRLNRLLVERLAHLSGFTNEAWNWCFYGAAGRFEVLPATEPRLALICAGAAAVPPGRQALTHLRRQLAECGFLPYSGPDAELAPGCATLDTWRDRFTRWIEDPVVSGMHDALPLFDLRPAFGASGLLEQLGVTARQSISNSPLFLKLLANDCLSALPPLTFFAGAVVDDTGERAEVFALEQRALGPMVEVGRVFGIAHGHVLGASTLERLAWARSRMPEHESIFREAAETLRVLLYLQARTGLRLQTSGSEILPAQLSRQDRQALKSGFRAIHRLLAFTIKQFWAATEEEAPR